MGNVACGLGDSGDCAPAAPAPSSLDSCDNNDLWNYEICTLKFKLYQARAVFFSYEKVLTYTGFKCSYFWVLTSAYVECNQRIFKCTLWMRIWTSARSRLEVTSAWWFVLLFSLSFPLSCVVWTHIAGYLVLSRLTFSLHFSPVNSFGLRFLAFFSNPVLQFYMCYRISYFHITISAWASAMFPEMDRLIPLIHL